MNATVSFKLYELFIPLVKEETKAREIVTNIEEIIDNKYAAEKDRLATKEDLSETKAELLKWMFALFLPFYIGMIVFLIKQFV